MKTITSSLVLVVGVALGGCSSSVKDVTMAPKLFRILIPASDIERATRFYRTVLACDGIRVSDGRHYFDLGGTIMACYDPRADGDGYDARPNPEHYYIAVDDLDKTFAQCQSVGAEFATGKLDGAPLGEIAVRPWGERCFYIKDPTGNPVCFVDSTTMFTGD